MEHASCFDQLQAVELSFFEVLARKEQLVELRQRDKALGANSSGHTVDDDYFIYVGTGQIRGLLMIDPALETDVSKELEKENTAAKERRALRVERAIGHAKKK